MLLFVSCCPREGSRTRRLAAALLDRIGRPYTEVCLPERTDLRPLDGARLSSRTALLAAGRYDDPTFADARRFAEADEIVIAAPYWDLSFPSQLKVYLENVFAIGIVTRYGEDGRPSGLCRARRLWYVTTAGGPLIPDYGYGYVDRLARHYFGIPETRLVAAEGLDIAGADPEAILASAVARLPDPCGI